MADWISIAAAGAILPVSVVLLLILLKQGSITKEQAETQRVLGLLIDMVEHQSESIHKRMEKDLGNQGEPRPSILSYQKPKLPTEPRSQPPPPPPAKLKRW